MRLYGAKPNVKDTASLWASARSGASTPLSKSLILVGGSRIQLGIDIKTLENVSQKKVIQLAIDGQGPLEVIEDLASDPQVHGMILIDGSLNNLTDTSHFQYAQQLITEYHQNFKKFWFPQFEQSMKATLQNYSALYSSMIPVEYLVPALLSQNSYPSIYLKTLPNRQRDADYRLVKMPDFYIARVLRNLGHELPVEAYKNIDTFSQAVRTTAQQHARLFNTSESNFNRITQALNQLKQKGIQVVLVNFPVSGSVKDMDEIRFPKTAWQAVTSRFNIPVYDFRDYPQLQFELADGSHLDQSQKQAFTYQLATLIFAQ